MANKPPTLSILIAAHNEQNDIKNQINAVLSQRRIPNELILLDDGSTDRTEAEMISATSWATDGIRAAKFQNLLVKRFKNPQPSGASAATNFVAARSICDWVHSAGAADLVRPGAFEQWEEAVKAYPQAKLVCGDYLIAKASDGIICDQAISRWSPRPRFFTPAELVQLWQGRDFGHINTEATFIHRDIRIDEVPGLRWFADVWQLHMLALEHGLMYVPFFFTQRNMRPRGGGGNWSNPNEMDAMIQELVRQISIFPKKEIVKRFIQTNLLEMPIAGAGRARQLLTAAGC